MEWRVERDLVDYESAVVAMEERAHAIAAGEQNELVWLLEHPALYTAGTSARPEDLLDARFPVHRAGRGGQFTYHGPGQRVAYVLLDLRRRRQDVRLFVCALENWIIATLTSSGVAGRRREGRVGVWVARSDEPASPFGEAREDKIAAIGVRVRRWVTFHGVSINIAPNLSHFSGIVPCGLSDARFGVTSLADLGRSIRMEDFDAILRSEFEKEFGPTRD